MGGNCKEVGIYFDGVRLELVGEFMVVVFGGSCRGRVCFGSEGFFFLVLGLVGMGSLLRDGCGWEEGGVWWVEVRFDILR